MSRKMRGLLIFLAGLALFPFAGCASSRPSPSEAESAISGQARGRLSAPNCEEAIGQEAETGGTNFYCSVGYGGRKVKAWVSIPDTGQPLVLIWPCAPANLTWKQVREDPRRRCGKQPAELSSPTRGR
jgi:hypothetical protein